MPQTHGAGRLFWHKINLRRDAPRHHRFTTYEYEHPFRTAEAHVVRLLGRFGVSFGRWEEERLDEDEAPALAAQAHETEVTDEVADRVRNYGWTVR